jgi:hypothetical protein
VLCALLCAGLAVPLVRRRVPPNRLYGARFRKAFESDDLWYAINEYGGRRLVVWSAVVFVAGIGALFAPLDDSDALTIVFALAPMVYLIGCLETWLFARHL